jgi:hypothetical protein
MGGVRFCIARRILGMHAILRRGRGLVTGKKSLGSIREMPDGEIRTRISGALLGTSDGVIPPHLSRAREAFVGLGADGHFCPPPSASFRALAVSLCAILLARRVPPFPCSGPPLAGSSHWFIPTICRRYVSKPCVSTTPSQAHVNPTHYCIFIHS